VWIYDTITKNPALLCTSGYGGEALKVGSLSQAYLGTLRDSVALSISCPSSGIVSQSIDPGICTSC
jgi:hypothetical protein